MLAWIMSWSWQIGTPWADGTAAISQCAINPEETFTYRFVVDKVLTAERHSPCSCRETN